MKLFLMFLSLLMSLVTNLFAQNYSLQFDGLNDYGKTTQVADVGNNFTIEFWAKPTAEDIIVNEGINGQIAARMVLHPPHGTYNWGTGHAGVGITVATNTITVNEHAANYLMSRLVWVDTLSGWNHIAVVYENKTPKLYVNGTLVKTGLTSNYDYVHPSLGYDGYPDYTSTNGIGSGMNGGYYEGLLDELRISDIIRYNNNFTPPLSFNNDTNTTGLYHFNEGTGNIITDESSNSNNGILDGPIWSSDVPMQFYSLQFDGINNYVEIPDAPTLDLTTNFTLEMIVKIDTQPIEHNSLLSKNPNTGWGSGWEIAYGQYSSNIFSFFGSPNGNNTTATLNFPNSIFENWYHLAAVYDGSEMRIYVNGILGPRSTLPASGLMAANGLPVVLGRRAEVGGNTHFFNGQIYSVKLSNISIYNSNFDPPLIFENDPNTVALYNIDEGSGNIIFDQSGNGNDGIIYGANWSSEYPNELSSLLVLSSPDGGESWGTGTTELITWANTNNVENIKIDYSTNNGSTWINIVTSTPSAPGSYPWTIPNTPSSESLVKITDVSNSELYDISQLTFQITGGDLTVLSPNGGETFNVGETEAIQWSSSNISNVKIDYSTDDGSTWLNIVASIPAGSGSYNWLVPNTPSQLCKVKISDAANPSLYDVSNSNFTIVGSTVELTRPNGGENFTIGTNEQILWNSNNVDNIHLEYSTNNGSTWSTIIASTPAGSGSYDWSVPNTPSVNCLVKITDASNPSIFDISDNVFIISDILINVSIVADTIWYDDNFDGLELGQVDGSGSSISQGTIVSYTWTVNGIVLSTDPTPVIELENGTNFVRLTIVGDQGHSNSDSLAISVYAAQLSTGGAIRSGISQIGDIFYATSMDQGVYRFDSTASSLPPFMTGGSIQSTLCISNNNYLYVGSDDTRIYAFDTDLNSIWDKAMGGVIVSSPSVTSDANRLYIGTESGILKAIDANDGSPLWSFAADGSIVSSPSIIELVDSVGNVLETIIYFGSGNGTFYALIDMGGTYSTFWQLETDLDSAIISSPAISNEGIIYFGSTNGYLYRVTWDGIYSTTWKNYTGGRIESSPVIGNDSIVYIASESGYLYGFEKEFLYNSNPVKSFYQDVGINGTPSIGPEGTIYIGCNNGHFYALENVPGVVDLRIKWFLISPAPIYSPSLVTETGLALIGNLDGEIFIMKDPSLIESRLSSFVEAEWPTFKGNNKRAKVVQIIQYVSGISESENIPTLYSLYQNFPNPYNPTTTIKYQIPDAGFVTLKVYDILGNEVAKLVNESKEEGRYQVMLDASALSSGVYIYQIKVNDFVDTKKMILLK